jgi:hypothetical protein
MEARICLGQLLVVDANVANLEKGIRKKLRTRSASIVRSQFPSRFLRSLRQSPSRIVCQLIGRNRRRVSRATDPINDVFNDSVHNANRRETGELDARSR